MGLGPIPRSKIEDYADEYELFGDAAERFGRLIRAMDSEHQTLANATDNKKPGEVLTNDVDGLKRMFGNLENNQKVVMAQKGVGKVSKRMTKKKPK